MGQVEMEFMITRGDRSVITIAFAVTRNVTATEGKTKVYATCCGQYFQVIK